MLISAEGISKTFLRRKRKTEVLQPTDLNLESGRLTVIFGRSGSGKTTLLNILAGLITPTSGRVVFDGKDISSMTDRELSRFRNGNIGYIPQGQSALAVLTVYENLLLPAALSGSDLSARADELIAAAGLDELRDSYPDELSGGELRRLAIARALINSPKVIFADEPTNDLDDENTALVLELLKAQAEKGAAVVIVTHESRAAAYADEILRMDGGVLRNEKEDEHGTEKRRSLVS
jgi:putative ABC transport system ATP-binding protein